MEVVADINLLGFVGCTHLIAEAVGYRNLLHPLLAVFSFELDIQDEIVLSTLSLVLGDFSHQAHGIPPVEPVGKGMAMMVFVGHHREAIATPAATRMLRQEVKVTVSSRFD